MLQQMKQQLGKEALYGADQSGMFVRLRGFWTDRLCWIA
jgi:hypothetical protein